MNEIKVTVAYEKPTTSKFDALMAEYEAAKKYADETVAYYKPLADVVGQSVGNGEFLHAGCPCLLNDADIGDIVGQHGVKMNFQIVGIAADIVCL